MKNVIIKIFLLFLIGILIISLFNIVKYQYNKMEAEKQLDELRQKIMENPETVDTVETQTELGNETTEATKKMLDVHESSLLETQDEEILEILPEYEDLYNENEDLIGWIKIDDMVIDYPVMQTVDDPIYYNHIDWDKNYSTHGLPLIDARCTLDSENIIIYSHNMKDGTMFGSLKRYKDKSFYKEHQIIEFDTIYEKSEYQIIAVLLSKAYYDVEPKEKDFVFYDYIDMDEEKFQEYVNQVKTLSLYDTGVTAEYGDKLITLCTCHYHVQDGRLLVVAKKIQ